MLWAVLLLALGLGLILAEIFIPSMGVLSVLATACIAGSIAFAFGEDARTGVRFLIAAAILVPAFILVGFQLFPRTPMGRHMTAQGFSFENEPTADARDRDLLGVEGEVTSPLRPAGHARLGERRVDVVSRGEAVEVGERVVVIEVRGNRVVVARAPREPQSK